MPDKEINSIKKALHQELKKAVEDGFTVFLSGFADGVDQYFAEIVLELQKENGT
ncbi:MULTISPECIES: SLOG family protein [Eisenbergiella]|uniref:SLOG family protein n=1 Tax=Eisenbergiella TaxID=1432051 RepID=UPI002ED0A18F